MTAFLTHLTPSHRAVLAELAALGVTAFFGTGKAYNAEDERALAALGARTTFLESLCSEPERSALTAQALERANEIRQLLPARPAAVEARSFAVDRERLDEAFSDGLGERMAHSALMLRALDRLQEASPIGGVVVSEEYSREAALLVRWARCAGVPSFLIAHGTNHMSQRDHFGRMLSDYALVGGVRAVESFVDIGIDPRRISVVGSPAYDVYPDLVRRRDAIRKEVRAKLGLAAGTALVLFGVTASESWRALSSPEDPERTLLAFLRGAQDALRRKVSFVAIIKDRPYNGKLGAERVRALNERIGVPARYVDGRAELLIVAADAVVAVESNLNVESMICGVPTIDVWTPMSWLHGPGFAYQDGIDIVPTDEPELLGTRLHEVLSKPAKRAEVIARQSAARPRFIAEVDGQAARRCAQFCFERSRRGSG